MSLGLPLAAWAQTLPVSQPQEVIVFVRAGCVHCEQEKVFLEKLASRRPITVKLHDLADDKSGRLWEEFTSRLQISKVTPITIIGREYLVGFDSAETTGKEIIRLITQAQDENLDTDLSLVTKISSISASQSCDESGDQPCVVERRGVKISLPFVGTIDSAKYPLLVLSAILGFFDGFNPCAMWVLVTFLIILLQTGSRKRMLAFAGVFILAEASMYAAILTVWYKTWNFVRLDALVTPVVGVVSIFGGFIFLREWRKKELECHVTDLSTRHRTHEKLQKLASEPFTILTFIGILGVAFSVNIIEFACSVGIPQAFTKILELNQMGFGQNLLFLLIYILFYMLDDFLVFGLAIYGADKLALTGKYSKLSNLLGGVLMTILGLIMIFRPMLVKF